MDYIFYATKNEGLPDVLMSNDGSDVDFEFALNQLPFKVRDYVLNHAGEDYEFVLQLHR